jgi:hypothetical protein
MLRANQRQQSKSALTDQTDASTPEDLTPHMRFADPTVSVPLSCDASQVVHQIRRSSIPPGADGNV